jgi:hypothetical protein
VTRIAVNGADKPDQRTEVGLAAEPEIQLVCSTNDMCHIGIALKNTAIVQIASTPLHLVMPVSECNGASALRF